MSGLRPAVPQLVALAAAMRTDWDSEDLDMAILAATQAGWEWERTAREVWRLLWTEDGSPASLRAACVSPLERVPRDQRRRERNPEYAAFREQLDAMPPLPEHRSGAA